MAVEKVLNHAAHQTIIDLQFRFPGGSGAEDDPGEAVRAHEVHPGARQGKVLRHDEGAQRGQRQGKEERMHHVTGFLFCFTVHKDCDHSVA